MILEKGNMWDTFGKTGAFIITTNPIIRKDGACVMGRGIAKEAATRFPELPYDLGKAYKDIRPYDGNCNAGMIGSYDKQGVWYFTVKSHWSLPADLTNIEDSLICLTGVYELHKYWDRIDLNFPGIGNGKLSRESVLPLLEKYLTSDVYHVWEYGK